MCLAVPSKIVQIQDGLGIVEVDGVRREVSLMLLEDPRLGDYVIVHAGFAIHTIDEQAAMETLALLREALAMTEDQDQTTEDKGEKTEDGGRRGEDRGQGRRVHEG